MFVGWIKPDHIVPGGQAIFDVVEALGFREFVVALAKFGTMATFVIVTLCPVFV
jgi:hypothetical protein